MTREEHEAILQQKLNEQAKKYQAVIVTILDRFSSVIESRDSSTGQHVVRSGKCAGMFARSLKDDPDYYVTDAWCRDVSYAATLHDLGKISVPDNILKKPGRFSQEEFEHMKMHAIEGARIEFDIFSDAADHNFMQIATNIAHYHHERWDGTGYPRGLAGETIPLEARVMALADVFDALVSKRCYKESMSYDMAFDLIEKNLGTQFDPVLGKKFLAMRDQIVELYNHMKE